jgi:hypothetical protein
MPMPLFPEPTGFVEECQTSMGFVLEDNISQHKLFELAIHVDGEFSSNKQKEGEFCKLLSRMLKNVPTEDGPMRVMWAKVMRMLVAYRKSVDTAQKHKEFDPLWSPGRNDNLRQKLQETFRIDPPQVLT